MWQCVISNEKCFLYQSGDGRYDFKTEIRWNMSIIASWTWPLYTQIVAFLSSHHDQGFLPYTASTCETIRPRQHYNWDIHHLDTRRRVYYGNDRPTWDSRASDRLVRGLFQFLDWWILVLQPGYRPFGFLVFVGIDFCIILLNLICTCLLNRKRVFTGM